MAARAAALFILCLFVHYASSKSCDNSSRFSFDSVLAEYDRENAPSVPVTVLVALDVRHASMIETQPKMRLLADLILDWKDDRLKWNATDRDCDFTQASAERLWLPDISLLNGMETSGVSNDDFPAKVTSDGSVTWRSRLDLAVPVAMQLDDWPKDVQRSNFIFGSSHASSEVVLGLNLQKFVTVSESGAWEIIKVTSVLSKTEASEATEETDIVKWQVSVRRRAPAHSLATGAVFTATVLELVAATMMPVEGRSALCACAAFTATLWLISALLRLPLAGTTPVTLSLMSALCITSAVACIFSGIVQRVARFRASPPGGVTKSLLTAAAGLCRLTPDEGASLQAESGAWVAAAKLLDNVLIAALLLTLFVIVCVYMFS